VKSIVDNVAMFKKADRPIAYTIFALTFGVLITVVALIVTLVAGVIVSLRLTWVTWLHFIWRDDEQAFDAEWKRVLQESMSDK
jgi:hypothetical protein